MCYKRTTGTIYKAETLLDNGRARHKTQDTYFTNRRNRARIIQKRNACVSQAESSVYDTETGRVRDVYK